MRAAGVHLVALLALLSAGCFHSAKGPKTPDRQIAKTPDWQIVFTSDRGGEFAHWAIRPDGTGLVRIGATNPAPDGEGPVVAPDGTKLLLPHSDGLVILDAGGRRRLASGSPTTASWSPDGERVAFNGLSPGLSVIDGDGKNGRRLTGNERDTSPVWAPGGDEIAFVREFVGVGVVHSDGSGGRILWRGSAEALSWSNDARSLSFLGHRSYRAPAELVTVEVAGARVVRTVRGVDADLYDRNAWSPDGRRIAFTRWVGRRQARPEIYRFKRAFSFSRAFKRTTSSGRIALNCARHR